MNGKFISVWTETYNHIWDPLCNFEDVPDDIFIELYRTLIPALIPPTIEAEKQLVLADEGLLRHLLIDSAQAAGKELSFSFCETIYQGVISVPENDWEGRLSALEEVINNISIVDIPSHDLVNCSLDVLLQNRTELKEAFDRAQYSIINNKARSSIAFQQLLPHDFIGESQLLEFFEKTYSTIEDICGEAISRYYFNHLSNFIEKFSLRYDLRQPCILCPTISGLFTSLVRTLHKELNNDGHLACLLTDFENALRDIRSDNSEARIKTCIQKQFNLIEALGMKCPNVTGNTMGLICKQLDTWPHAKVRESMVALYGFSCDYPGIRHGGMQQNATRPIDMRDLLSMTILLTGFTPYLGDLNAKNIYTEG